MAPLVLCCTALAGCAILPGAGPNRQEISDASTEERPGLSDFLLTDINEGAITLLNKYSPPTLQGQFGDRRPPSNYVIGMGDTITVTIWEGAAGGLFSRPATDGLGTGSQVAPIPEQQVAQDGAITVPFAGRIKVAGQTAQAVEQAIVEKLAGKAIEPQVLVVVTRSVNNAVTVIGEVNAPARVPLTPAGERMLDVIALAGGNKAPSFETFVTLTRRNRTAMVPLQTIIARPAENIYIYPGDTISLVRDPQTFTAFGASAHNALVPFEAAGISLEEAIAKAGGLLDSRADPQGVYLMRLEPEKVARMIRPDYTKPARDGKVLVIYQLNMRNPDAILLARQFQIRNKDAIYIANAPLNELNKVLSVFSTAAQPVSQGASIAGKFY